MVIFNAGLFRGEPTGTGRCKSMTYTIEYTHATTY